MTEEHSEEARRPEGEPTTHAPLQQEPAQHTPYQRKHATHRTQPAIDDLAQDGQSSELYTHDSNIAIKGGSPLSGREYRRSRSGMPQLQRSVHYGQYLEVPKGRRAIFASQERKRRRNSLITLVVVIVVLAIVAIAVWRIMNG